MEMTLVATGRGVMIQPKIKKTGKRLQDLVGFIKYEGPRVPDEELCAPVDYSEDWEASEKRSR
jgi:hypothetical protein